MSLLSLLESKGTLKRPVIGRDSSKGVTQASYATLATDKACSVQPAALSVIEFYSQRNMSVSVTIFLQEDISAEVNDEFIVIDENSVVHTYLVQGTHRALFGRLFVPYSMDCMEVK